MPRGARGGVPRDVRSLPRAGRAPPNRRGRLRRRDACAPCGIRRWARISCPPGEPDLMPRRLLAVVMAAVVAPASVALAAPGHAHDTVFRSRGVTAAVTATGASLSNGRVSRTWAFGAAGSVTTTGLGGASGRDWAADGADFQLDLDGVPTSSTSGWVLDSATPLSPPELPNRIASGKGAALLFRYALASASLPAGGELHPPGGLPPGPGPGGT